MEEIEKRGLSPEDKPQDIYTYKNSFLKQRDVGGIPKCAYTIAIVAGSFIFLLITNALMGPGRILNMITGAVVFAVGGGIYYSFKKRFQPKDTKPQEIPNYEDSSFKQNDTGGSSKWFYAIAILAIFISLVVIISNYSSDETGTGAPKKGFNLQEYYNKNKEYYGDASLADVAQDIYEREGHAKNFGTFENFKKETGIDSAIQEDIKRRTPSFLSKLMGAIPFRYDEESIHGSLYRYDRFNKTVEQRYGNNENSFKWLLKPQFKNLQHVRDLLAKWAVEDAIEEKNQDLEDSNEELQQSNKDLKRSVVDLKREQEDRAFRERMGLVH